MLGASMRRIALAGALAVASLAALPALAGDILEIKVAGVANGTVDIQLFRDIAPHHVDRIEELAKAGAYDGVVFHRVIEGFMAQTGDVEYGKRDGGNLERAGIGGSDKPNLKAEFSDRRFERGVVGMARGRGNDTANSQFFIMFDSAEYLNGKYTVVGKVISGMDVVDKIKKGSSAMNGAVRAPMDYMEKVTVKDEM